MYVCMYRLKNKTNYQFYYTVVNNALRINCVVLWAATSNGTNCTKSNFPFPSSHNVLQWHYTASIKS
jgi:hypothetical protein